MIDTVYVTLPYRVIDEGWPAFEMVAWQLEYLGVRPDAELIYQDDGPRSYLSPYHVARFRVIR